MMNDGNLISHEIATGENPLLLSLAAQKTLGLVTDVETGACYWESNNSFVQLYSVVGSSLRAIVIHDPQWSTRFSKGKEHDIEDVNVPDDIQTSPSPSPETDIGMQAEAFDTAYDLAAKRG